MIGVQGAWINVQRANTFWNGPPSCDLSKSLPGITLELRPRRVRAAFQRNALVDMADPPGARVVEHDRAPSLDLAVAKRLRVFHHVIS